MESENRKRSFAFFQISFKNICLKIVFKIIHCTNKYLN